MLRVIAIGVLFSALLLGGGCSSETGGQLDREKLFVPLLGFGQAYLRIDLGTQIRAGGILIKYLDFSGQRVAMEVVPLPSHHGHWAGIMGRGAKKNGRAYYGLKIERFGPSDGPLHYSFRPLAGSRPGPLGLFDRES